MIRLALRINAIPAPPLAGAAPTSFGDDAAAGAGGEAQYRRADMRHRSARDARCDATAKKISG